MPRSIWKGVSFGLVTFRCASYTWRDGRRTSPAERADSGRIRYKRVCRSAAKEVPFAEIAKGYEAADGKLAILEAADFADLPAAEGQAVEVVQFVDVDQIVDLLRTYFLEAEKTGTKPYVLLRQARRQREGGRGEGGAAFPGALALIRPVGDVLRIHVIWPDRRATAPSPLPPRRSKVGRGRSGDGPDVHRPAVRRLRPSRVHRRPPRGVGRFERSGEIRGAGFTSIRCFININYCVYVSKAVLRSSCVC